MSDDLVRRAAALVEKQKAWDAWEYPSQPAPPAIMKGEVATLVSDMAEDITSLRARVAELEGALKKAAESVGDWGTYASQYLQDKWDLPGEVARYIAIAEGKNDAALEGGKE